jgi:hypothetical protein
VLAVHSEKGAFAKMAAAVMILVSLASGWGEPTIDVTAEGAGDANRTGRAINMPQHITEVSTEGEQLTDHVTNMSALKAVPRQRVGTMSEYLRRAPDSKQDVDLLGIRVDDGMDPFEGEHISGAEIIDVQPSSPGALAGLRSQGLAINTALRAITVVGTLAFPRSQSLTSWSGKKALATAMT